MSETAPHRFSRTAKGYAESASHARGATLERLPRLLRAGPDDVGLDIAAGTGNAAFAVAPHARAVVLLDPAEGMRRTATAEARARGVANVAIAGGMAERLPFRDAAFDLVFSRIAPHHFTDIAQAVREMARVARPGARVCVVDLAGPPDAEVRAFLHELEVLKDPTHVRSYTAAEWSELLAGAGLVVEYLEYGFVERPGGTTLTQWTGVAQTAPASRDEIARRLRAVPARVRTALRVREGEDGEIHFDTPSVVAVALKLTRT